MGKPKCYIESMVKTFGDDWIVAMSPETLQRQGRRIAKDMVRGSINYEVYGKYFLDAKFLENLIIACSNEYEVVSLHYNAMIMYQQYYPFIPNIMAVINHDWCESYIFGTIIQRLNNLKYSGNLGELYDIAGVLAAYKNHLN